MAVYFVGLRRGAMWVLVNFIVMVTCLYAPASSFSVQFGNQGIDFRLVAVILLTMGSAEAQLFFY